MNKLKTSVPQETLEQQQLRVLGRALRNARHDQKLMIKTVKEKSGVSVVTISKLERGELKNSNLDTMNKIATSLGLKISITVTPST